jgi:hypothetical protein
MTTRLISTTIPTPEPCRMRFCAACIGAEAQFWAMELRQPLRYERLKLRFVRVHGCHVVSDAA